MITIKTEEQIAYIRVAGSIIKNIISIIPDMIIPNMSTQDLDKMIYENIIKEGGEPAFLGYNEFPASTCISINEEIIHGTPSPKKIIKKDDVISVDIGVRFQKYIADSAYTFYTGTNSEIHRLITSTQDALTAGIEAITATSHVADISKAIAAYGEKNNLGIVRDYCGHGVGIELHEPPEIPNYYPLSNNPRLRPGMVIAVEPMFTLGSAEIILLDDNFTVASKDKSYAAHFEHTVLITHDGTEILT